ncbi:MAG TPA: hypothetical protein VEU08_22190 [Vicinamibacterales bacterium]|nr:hypothetical protein [Vicinamibacterales bacterium]
MTRHEARRWRAIAARNVSRSSVGGGAVDAEAMDDYPLMSSFRTKANDDLIPIAWQLGIQKPAVLNAKSVEQYATKTLPVVQQHLQRAEDLLRTVDQTSR